MVLKNRDGAGVSAVGRGHHGAGGAGGGVGWGEKVQVSSQEQE